MKKLLLTISFLMMLGCSVVGATEVADDSTPHGYGYTCGGYGVDDSAIFSWEGNCKLKADDILSVYGTETNKYYGNVRVIKEIEPDKYLVKPITPPSEEYSRLLQCTNSLRVTLKNHE